MAENWFLKIDGVEGESADARHKGEIDVLAWSWGVTQSAAGGPGPGGGSGGGAGRADFQEFHFVSRISKASPKLFLAAASGQRFKWAQLSGARAGGKGGSADFLKYKLSDVIVTSVQHADDEGEEPTEQFSLNYSKFEISYTEASPSGKVSGSVDAAWDVSKSAKL